MEPTMRYCSAGVLVRRWALLAILAAVVSCAMGAEPEPPAPPPKQSDPTAAFLAPEAIQGRMKQVEASGGRAIGGLGMLVRQGAAAFKIWTGVEPPVDVMLAAAQSELDGRD